VTAHVVIKDACALADPLEVLKARAWARAHLWAAGEFSLHEAVDPLQQFAERSGLLAKIGQDAVQAIMAEAFAAVRRDLVSEGAKPSQAELADIPIVARHGVPSAGALQREYEARLRRRDREHGPPKSVRNLANCLAHYRPERLRIWLLERSERERDALVAYLRGKQR
jgi:hypothetical protein